MKPYDDPETWAAYHVLRVVWAELIRQAEGDAVRISSRDMAAKIAFAYAELTEEAIEDFYAVPPKHRDTVT